MTEKSQVTIRRAGKETVLLIFSEIPETLVFDPAILFQMPGIAHIRFSKESKSITLIFEPARLRIRSFVKEFKQIAPNLSIREEKTTLLTHTGRDVHSPQEEQEDDALSQIIWHGVDRGNKNVKTALHNTADLTSLIPIALFTLSILQLVRQPIMPRWNELAWYGYSIFRDFNSEKKYIPHFHNEEAQDENRRLIE